MKKQYNYITRIALSKMLGVHISTIDNWRKDGTVTAYQLGGRIFFKMEEIEQAMTELVSRK